MSIKTPFLEHTKKHGDKSVCDKPHSTTRSIFVAYCLKLVSGIYMYVKEFMNKIDVFYNRLSHLSDFLKKMDCQLQFSAKIVRKC